MICIGRNSPDFSVDVNKVDSIRSMYRQLGRIDAVISAVGAAQFAPLGEMRGELVAQVMQSKFMAQINLVLEGLDFVNDEGSFTLTSGLTNRTAIKGGAAAAAANGALDGFIFGAAEGMPRGIRINAVSPGPLQASRSKYPQRYIDHHHLSNEEVGRAFVQSVEGELNGTVIVVD